MVRGNIIAACAALAVAAVTYILSAGFPPVMDGAPGPGYVPNILASAFVVLSLILLGQTWFAWRREKSSAGGTGAAPAESATTPANPAARRAVCVFILVCAAYAVLIALAGFVIASLVFIPAGMLVMGERSVKHMVLLSVGLVGMFYLVFGEFFNMVLPAGMLFE